MAGQQRRVWAAARMTHLLAALAGTDRILDGRGDATYAAAKDPAKARVVAPGAGDPTVTAVIGGGPTTLTIDVPGGTGTITFAGIANQRVSIQWGTFSLSTTDWPDITVKNPDGFSP
jgi:hypothetical protein